MSSIWNTLNKRKADVTNKGEGGKKAKIQDELSDEIKQFRQKKKEFDATNDTETYVVLCFSTNNDRKQFVQNVLPKKGNQIYLDGYEFARVIGKMPDKPSLKLPKPLNKKK